MTGELDLHSPTAWSDPRHPLSAVRESQRVPCPECGAELAVTSNAMGWNPQTHEPYFWNHSGNCYCDGCQQYGLEQEDGSVMFFSLKGWAESYDPCEICKYRDEPLKFRVITVWPLWSTVSMGLCTDHCGELCAEDYE